MLTAALPDTAGLTVTAACAALHAHGCADAEVFRLLGHRATVRTLRARLCEAKAAARSRTAPVAHRPPESAPPLETLKPGEQHLLRETVRRMGQAQRARFLRLKVQYPALEAAGLALRPDRGAQPC